MKYHGEIFKLWKEMDGNLHAERGPGWHVVSIARHGEATEGEAAAGCLECFRYLEIERNVPRRQC